MSAVAQSKRWVLHVAGCAVLDGAAAAILLCAPRLSPVEWIACAGLRLMAVAAVSVPRGPSSQRWLCAAAVGAVPLAGALVAAVALGVRRRGEASEALRRGRAKRETCTEEDARQLAERLSPCDAIDGSDRRQLRDALAGLVERGDGEAGVVLHWAAAHAEPETAMAAALALDQAMRVS